MTETPDDREEINGDEGPKIIEPPLDPEDTQPLNPLRKVRPQRPADQEGRKPPATVLREATSSNIRPLRKPSPPPTIEDTDRVRLVPKVPDPPSWRVIFQIEGPAPTTIGLDVRQALVIGRVVPEVKEQPDLDLTPHLAIDHGISRQHAVLIPSVEGLHLVDLESTNGTWINGLYLEPGKHYLLSPGDTIEFGLLPIVVRNITTLRQSGG